LIKSRWNYKLFDAPNLLKDPEDLTITTLALGSGGARDTEIWDPVLQQWLEYQDIPDDAGQKNLMASLCLVQLGDIIYHINEQEFGWIDVSDWTGDTFDDVPARLTDPGQCALVRIGGIRGLMLWNGYWFNFATEQWAGVRSPPYPSFVDKFRSMHSWRGRATIFNNPICDENANCLNEDVIQYDPDEDKWVTLGKLRHPRRNYEMLEVPRSFCFARDREPVAR